MAFTVELQSWSFSVNSILTTIKTHEENIYEGIWAHPVIKAFKIAYLNIFQNHLMKKSSSPKDTPPEKRLKYIKE
jgi:hypothetical protein